MYHDASHNTRPSLKHRIVFYNSEGNTYLYLRKLSFRFVLYQLSKNLNRPFFVDFLTHLSIRYTESGGKLDEEDPEETGWIFSNVLKIIQKSFILFLSTTNLHISHFPF